MRWAGPDGPGLDREGGGRGSSRNLWDHAKRVLSFPLPLNPPPRSNTAIVSERSSSPPPSHPFSAQTHFRLIVGLENAALSDGLVDTLTSKLTQLERFRGELMVVPASEIRSREIRTVEEARRIYGVNLVITGSVQRWGPQLQITANLVDAAGLRQLDAVTLDVEADELVALRDGLTARVAGMLDLELTPGARQELLFGETRLAEAYRAYLEGRGYVQRYDVEGNIDKAVQSFEEAIAIDDGYALAYSGLAEAYWRKADAANDAKWAEKAIENAERAVAINGDLATTRVKLGEIYAAGGREQDAVSEFEHALKLNPSSAGAHQGLGLAHMSRRFRWLTICGRVKCWRRGDHRERWVSASLWLAERNFRRVKGYKQLPKLLAELAKLNTPPPARAEAA